MIDQTIINRLARKIKDIPTNVVTSPASATDGNIAVDVDGWIRVVETWTYANPTIITVPSGALSKYRRGNAVKFTQDNIEKQFYIANVTDDSLTLTGGNNFILTDNGIEDIYYSFIKPLDFQNVFSWEPTYGASGSMTFTSVTTHFAFFKLDGDYLDVNVHATGTTGGTASNTITVSLPLVVRASFASCGIVTDPSNTGSMIYSSPNAIMSIRKYDSSNFGLGTGRIIVAGLKAKLL